MTGFNPQVNEQSPHLVAFEAGNRLAIQLDLQRTEKG
jgi:hypothetical protein